jgi:uncharacterized delta-60 repeat protein
LKSRFKVGRRLRLSRHIAEIPGIRLGGDASSCLFKHALKLTNTHWRELMKHFVRQLVVRFVRSFVNHTSTGRDPPPPDAVRTGHARTLSPWPRRPAAPALALLTCGAGLLLTLATWPAAAADGDVDPGFDPNANDYVLGTAEQPDGKIVIGGNFTTVGGVTRNNIARLNADGTLDTGFDLGANYLVRRTAVQVDGKIVIGGNFTMVGGVARNNIARLNADGTLDLGFNPNANSQVHGMALQADGQIVIGGFFTAIGGVPRSRMARLNADGTLDAGFDPNVSELVSTIAVQADGKIIIGGQFTTVGGVTRNRIARLNADGTLDGSFAPGANYAVVTTVVQADGKIVIGGAFTDVSGEARSRIARLNADGTLDPSFNPPTIVGGVYSVALQADGRMIIAGNFTRVGSVTRNGIARLNADSTLDMGFNPDASFAASPLVWSTALQADGKVVIGGTFTAVGGVPRNRIARLVNGLATQTLTVVSPARVEWLRGGTAPETTQVTFELSSDGTTWTPLGAGTRISGGWELTGLSLPASGMIRARARTTGGHGNGSAGLVEQQVAFTLNTPPVARCRNVTVAADAGCQTTASIDNGSFDPDSGDTITVSQNPPEPYALGDTLVTLTVTDSHGACASCTATVTVNDNQPPTIACPPDITQLTDPGRCDAVVQFSVSASDNCPGVTVTCSSESGAVCPLGSTRVTCTATDGAGLSAMCSFTITIENPPPEASVTGPPSGAVFPVGTLVTLAGTCTDNAGDMHTATWICDGTPVAGEMNELTGEVTATVAFTMPGVYQVALTITDVCGNSVTVTSVDDGPAMVVIYDPNGGFVTGGGWITSPPGAYPADPALTGKASFGFVSKYQKGATAPSGQTEFLFRVANFNFHSLVYEWLVVAGPKAQYKGTGTVNGAGEYGFLLTATDGQVLGGGDQDKFRIKIWDKAANLVVYDNVLGASDDVDNANPQVIGGGSIVIHKTKPLETNK